jgi:hypothetical protein
MVFLGGPRKARNPDLCSPVEPFSWNYSNYIHLELLVVTLFNITLSLMYRKIFRMHACIVHILILPKT